MGSHTFQQTIGGKKMTAEEGYRELVDNALHEYGHDPYNGTISTTNGFVLVEQGRKQLETAMRDELNRQAYDVRKWGPAGCIELRGSQLTRWRRQHGLARTRARAFLFFGWAAS
jgi:hypothetical protein